MDIAALEANCRADLDTIREPYRQDYGTQPRHIVNYAGRGAESRQEKEMATYEELYALGTNDVLRQKTATALVVAAQAKLAGTPTAAEAAWARGVIANPIAAANQVVYVILAANKDAAAAAIISASDTAIQTNVDAVVAGLVA